MNFSRGLSEQKMNRKSKFRDIKHSAQKDVGFLKNKRSLSMDSRSRGSYVPERKRPSSEERKSGNSGLMRWSGARGSSTLADGKRSKDIRPLSDKTFQKKKVCEILEFLETANFKYPINASKLLSPSKKDYEIVFQFLYNSLDPVYEVKKFDDEAPKILKYICYPFTVNKSAFTYVARSSFPSLLGILIFLVDLNKFLMKVDMKIIFELGDNGGKTQIHSILFRYIYQRYYSQNDGEDEDESVFIQIIKSSMTDDDEVMKKNEEIKLQLSSVEKEIDTIKALSEEKVELESQIEKYEEYFVKMESHYQKRSEFCKQLQNDLMEKESELKILEEEIAKKQDVYDAQGYDGQKQLLYFEMQKKELLEKLDEKDNTIKEIQDKLWESEIQFKQNSEKVSADDESFKEVYDNIVKETRSDLQPLQHVNVPRLKKLISSFYLDFPDFIIQAKKSYADWSITYKNNLENIGLKITSTNDMLQGVILSLNEKESEIQARQSELSTQLKLLSFKSNQVQHAASSKKTQAVVEVSSLEAEVEKVDQAVKILQAEKLKLTNMCKEMTEEFKSLDIFKQKREKNLNTYLENVKKVYDYCLRMEKKAESMYEAFGNEIAAKFEELKEA